MFPFNVIFEIKISNEPKDQEHHYVVTVHIKGHINKVHIIS